MTSQPQPSAASPSRAAEVLKQARQRDSQKKRARVRNTVEDMLTNSEPITFTAVARKAKVSTWLVYADGVREHIEQAVAHQAEQSTNDGPPDEATPASLRTDLALARAEIKHLRAQRDTLRRNTQRLLGRQLDQVHTTELIERIDSLVAENRTISTQLHQALETNAGLQSRVVELEEDLGAARTSLRRMIKEHSHDLPHTPESRS